MSEEELREKIRYEFLKNINDNLDSAMIFSYIKSLEDKLDNAIEYIKLATDGITEYLDIKEIKELLEILGDKE